MQSPDDRICSTKGAARLPGLVAELRRLDPWSAVVSVKRRRTIEGPVHMAGAAARYRELIPSIDTIGRTRR
jgi:hypothetical protein